MSDNRNAIIEKTISNQLQKSNQQVKNNIPIPIPTPGSVTIIKSIPPEGYYIVAPGSFVFANDIHWKPSQIFSTAIYILSDDVDLDLSGFNLIAEGDYKSTAIGIKIGDGITCCKNVSIENGAIKNLGYCGLSAVKTYLLNLTKITVDGLSYQNFDILPSGIFVEQAKSFIIDSCVVTNTTVTAMLFAGILIMKSNKGLVYKCIVDQVINNDGVAAGYVYNGSSGIQSLGCQASNFWTHYGGDPFSTIGHTCIGFMPTESEDLTFTQCNAQGMTGCCDDCHGMSLFSVNNVEVIGFYADQIWDGNGPQKTGAKATGLEVYGDNITIEYSSVKNIFAVVPQDLQATGFSACGTSIKFDNCSAENVQVLDSSLKPNTQHGYGTGFGWAPDPRSQFVKPAVSANYNSCTSTNCQVGFDTWNHQNSVWTSPTTNNCPITILVQDSGAQRIYSMNFCSELPGSTPSSPEQNFPIINCAKDNKY